MYKDVANKILVGFLTICMVAGVVDLSAFTVRAAEKSIASEQSVDEKEADQQSVEEEDADKSVADKQDASSQTTEEEPTEESLPKESQEKDRKSKAQRAVVRAQDVFDQNGEWTYQYDTAMEYTGSQLEPTVTITNLTTNTTLTSPTDYTYSYGDNKNVSDGGTIQLIGAGNYVGSDVTLRFDITPKSFDVSNTSITVDPIDDMTFSGNPVIPNITVKDTVRSEVLTGVHESQAGVDTVYDYTYTCYNNAGAGQGQVLILGQGNYTDSRSVAFTIEVVDETNLTVSSIPDQIYNGTAKNPIPQSVTYNRNGTVATLVEGTDYTLSWPGECTKAGNTYVEITGINRYNGIRKQVPFKIIKNLSHSTITIEEPLSQDYTGAPITLTEEDIVVRDSEHSQPLRPNIDYKIINHQNNTAAGTFARITVEGISSGNGVYSGTKDRTFTINKVNLSQTTITVDPCTYDGTALTPDITVSKNGITYNNSEFSVRHTSNTDAGVNAGSVTVTPTNANFIGTAQKNFTIAPRPLTDGDVTMALTETGPWIYSNGAPIRPGVELKYKGTVINAGANNDYTIGYHDNSNAGQARAVATGNGNFTDSKELSFTIDPFEINQATATFTPINPLTYLGRPLEPSLNVMVNGNTLNKVNAAGVGDFTVDYSSNINAGQQEGVPTAVATIRGQGNYRGNAYTTFEIKKKDISNGDSTGIDVRVARIPNQTYTGSQQTPALNITYGVGSDGNPITLNSNSADYIAAYGATSANIDVGEPNAATVTITGTGNYKGTRTERFSIVPRNLATEGVLSLRGLNALYYYTGSPIEAQNLAVLYENTEAGMNFSLPVDDFIKEYQANTEIGQASLKITGTKNFTGSKTFTFDIKGNLEDEGKRNIVLPEQVYTGSPIDPLNMVVKFAGRELRKGEDYRVANVNSIEPGWGSAQIEGINYYTGNWPIVFEILPKDVNDPVDENYIINGINPRYEYNGYPREPKIDITYYNAALESPRDYTVDYQGNADGETDGVGEMTLAIDGKGTHFTGNTTRTYAVDQYDIGQPNSKVELTGVINDCILENIKDINDPSNTDGVAIDNGGVVQTDMIVTFNRVNDAVAGAGEDPIVLALGTDYEVEYEANTEIGEATVIIKGINKFTGEIRKTFKIRGDLTSNHGSLEVEPVWTFVPGQDDTGAYRNTPTPVVRYNGNILVGGEDFDYSISYTDNHRVGTATVSITANLSSKYAGTLNKTFEIIPRPLQLDDSELEIIGLEPDGYEFTGVGIVPQLSIRYMGEELTSEDIEITPYHNINVPEEGSEDQPFVRITAKEFQTDGGPGNYSGGFDLPFTINPRPLNEQSIRVEGVPNGIDYDGGNEVRVPDGEIKLYYGSETTPLTEGDGTTGDFKIEYNNNFEIGEATITFTARGNYEGSFVMHFYVQGVIDPGSIYMQIEDIPDVPYGIGAVYPKLIIIDNSIAGVEKTLAQSTDDGVTGDFKITSCINNVNVASKDSVNPPTVTIEGIGCYRGTYTGTFNIVPKDLSTDEGDITTDFLGSINNADVTNAYVYTGGDITPEVTVYNNGFQMVSNLDYTIEGFVHNMNVPAEDAPEDMRPGIIVRAKENGNYVGRKIIRFNIIPKDLSYVDISFTEGSSVIYNRQEQEPGVSVTFTTPDGVIHDFPTDNYDIDYQHNIDVGSPADAAEAPVVIITGKGNFTNSKTMAFTILPETLGADNPDIIATTAPAEYNGSPVGTTVTLKAADGTDLIENTDFTVGQCTNNTNAGTAEITVEGIGNYNGTWQVPFTINPRPVTDVTISAIEPKPYTAAAIEPEPEVTVNLGTEEQPSIVTLEKDTDYTLSWHSNTNAGTAYVVVTGKNNYASTSSKEQPFIIQKKNIGTNGVIEEQMTLDSIADQQYTGGPLKPGVSLTYQGAIAQSLAEGSDYTLSHTANTAVGTAAVTITGTGNYEGTIQTNFRILGNIAQASVGAIPLQKHTGTPVEPSPAVVHGGKTLVKDTDYELIYHNNINKGTATIEVKGKGEWYTGSKTVTFVIASDFSIQTQIIGLAPSYTYTGKAITPSVRVTDSGNVLTVGRDYRLSYKSNVSVGTAEVTVEGIGVYSGKKSATFKIIKRNIGQCSAASIGSRSYTGKKINPAVKLTYGGKTLKAGTDYTVVYTNNVKAGRANAIIKGKGNFEGTKTIGYNIVIPKVSGVKLSSYKTTSAKISWKKNNAVTGYEIYSSSNKRVARLSKTKTSYTITKLKPGKTYSYKIRSYAVKNGATKRSGFVTLKFSTAPSTAKISSIASSKSKQVVLKWKKISGATEYIVYRSTSKKGKYASIGTTKSTSYTDKKATSGRTYYYKIRVRRTVDKKNYYSSYSAIRSIKAKK